MKTWCVKGICMLEVVSSEKNEAVLYNYNLLVLCMFLGLLGYAVSVVCYQKVVANRPSLLTMYLSFQMWVIFNS